MIATANRAPTILLFCFSGRMGHHKITVETVINRSQPCQPPYLELRSRALHTFDPHEHNATDREEEDNKDTDDEDKREDMRGEEVRDAFRSSLVTVRNGCELCRLQPSSCKRRSR